MSARPAGIKAVAERAGVSVGTVSNVLNRPDQVSAPTRDRVEAAMHELSFVRSSSAGALRAGRSTALGPVVLDIGNPFFTDVARGVEHAAAERGYAVLLCSSDSSPERRGTYLRFLRSSGSTVSCSPRSTMTCPASRSFGPAAWRPSWSTNRDGTVAALSPSTTSAAADWRASILWRSAAVGLRT